jgi:hypothetical protein
LCDENGFDLQFMNKCKHMSLSKGKQDKDYNIIVRAMPSHTFPETDSNEIHVVEYQKNFERLVHESVHSSTLGTLTH